VTLRNAGPDPIIGVGLNLQLSSGLKVVSTLPKNTAVVGNTVFAADPIPVRGSLVVTITLEVTGKVRDRLTVSTTATSFTTTTRVRKNTIRVIA
jgi:hypothetical protein